jgi:hypothetical protein
MIRFVVTIKLKPDAFEKMERRSIHLPDVWEGLSNIESPGVLAFNAGFDVQHLLDSNWSFAVVIDYVDLKSFERWFQHPDHRRIGGPMEEFIAETSRVVFEIPD